MTPMTHTLAPAASAGVTQKNKIMRAAAASAGRYGASMDLRIELA
jgi:hypothetical protein